MNNPLWKPDGKTIYYLNSFDKKQQEKKRKRRAEKRKKKKEAQKRGVKQREYIRNYLITHFGLHKYATNYAICYCITQKVNAVIPEKDNQCHTLITFNG